MAQMVYSPTKIVFTTAATYSFLLAGSWLASWPTKDSRANLKAISSVHSLVIIAFGVAALLDKWPVDVDSWRCGKDLSKHEYLDDTQNPLIFGESSLGNAVTGFETGYLLYDTIALLYVTQRELPNGSKRKAAVAISQLARNEPLLLVHHIALLAALGILQVYIACGRERGVWIIDAFILIRATDPVLHWRWWVRKQTGKHDIRMDVLLIVTFAACRFGLLGWVLKAYGDHHHLNAWTAFMKQRMICKTGTGALFGLNAVWLAMLLRNTAKRLLRERKMI